MKFTNVRVIECSELEAFPFMVALVFWHDILFQVNYVSKQLQSENADLCDAVNNLERLFTVAEKLQGNSI